MGPGAEDWVARVGQGSSEVHESAFGDPAGHLIDEVVGLGLAGVKDPVGLLLAGPAQLVVSV